MKFYGYNKCSTCRKAKSFLEKKKIAFQEIDITEKPPSATLLKAILKTGQYEIGQLFNRSGVLYREMNMKDKIKTTSESALLKLLAEHGKLVKRPIVTDGEKFTVGFDEALFKKTWKS